MTRIIKGFAYVLVISRENIKCSKKKPYLCAAITR